MDIRCKQNRDIIKHKDKKGMNMKRILYVCTAVTVFGSCAVAGGDIAPVVEETPAVASGGFYAGAALSAVSTRDASVSMSIFNAKSGQDRLGNFTLVAGYEFNPYISAEGRYTSSFAKEDFVKMSGWSIFAKPQYPVTESLTVYALLGFGGIDLSPAGSTPVDVDETGFQWGLGASYEVMDNTKIFFDYTSLANDADGIYRTNEKNDADAFTLGFTYAF